MKLRILILWCFARSAMALDISGAALAAGSYQDVGCQNPAGAQADACQTIREAMNDPCVAGLLEQYRQMAAAGEVDGNNFCSNLASVAQNPQSFNGMITNLMGGICGAESSYNPSNSHPFNGRLAKGLFMLDAYSTNRGYQCCHGMTESDMYDAKKNAICGVGLNLQNMMKDRCIASGGGGDASSRGAARYQEVCRDVLSADQRSKQSIMAVTQSACTSAAGSGYSAPFSEPSGISF